MCVSLFYVIDTGSTGSRARHSRGELGCTHIYTMTNRCLRPTVLLLGSERARVSRASMSLPDEHGEIDSGRDTGDSECALREFDDEAQRSGVRHDVYLYMYMYIYIHIYNIEAYTTCMYISILYTRRVCIYLYFIYVYTRHDVYMRPRFVYCHDTASRKSPSCTTPWHPSTCLCRF